MTLLSLHNFRYTPTSVFPRSFGVCESVHFMCMKNIYILSDDNRRRFEFISLSFVYYFRVMVILVHVHTKTHRHSRTHTTLYASHTCLNKNVICVACGGCVTVCLAIISTTKHIDGAHTHSCSRWLHDVEIVAILHTYFFTGQIGHNSQRMRNGPCKRFEHTQHHKNHHTVRKWITSTELIYLLFVRERDIQVMEKERKKRRREKISAQIIDIRVA